MKKLIRIFLYVILITSLIFSSYSIYIKLSEYKKADNIYESIREINTSTEDNKDYQLSSINPDYRFWLKIDNTNIDYPVVQSKDNSYYLTHDFNKNYLASGSIFMDYRNNFEEDDIVILYGHHNIRDREFLKLTESNLIKIEYKDTTYTYEVFSVYVADLNDGDYLKVNFEDEEDKKEYLNYIKSRSLYKKDIELNSSDNIITLYTCSYEFDNARTIVHGKLISKK